MSELIDRRQRAREAFDDEVTAGPRHPMTAVTAAREAAIGTATRVQITPEAIAEAYPNLLPSDTARAAACLGNALRELGFEVVD